MFSFWFSLQHELYEILLKIFRERFGYLCGSNNPLKNCRFKREVSNNSVTRYKNRHTRFVLRGNFICVPKIYVTLSRNPRMITAIQFAIRTSSSRIGRQISEYETPAM